MKNPCDTIFHGLDMREILEIKPTDDPELQRLYDKWDKLAWWKRIIINTAGAIRNFSMRGMTDPESIPQWRRHATILVLFGGFGIVFFGGIYFVGVLLTWLSR